MIRMITVAASGPEFATTGHVNRKTATADLQSRGSHPEHRKWNPEIHALATSRPYWFVYLADGEKSKRLFFSLQ